MVKYYVDTCIWIDYLDDRIGEDGQPLGLFAELFLEKVKSEKGTILLSDVFFRELENRKGEEASSIVFMIQAFYLTETVYFLSEEKMSAKRIAVERSDDKMKISTNDVLHALIAKRYGAILVSRDAHFNRLADIAVARTPEEL